MKYLAAIAFLWLAMANCFAASTGTIVCTNLDFQQTAQKVRNVFVYYLDYGPDGTNLVTRDRYDFKTDLTGYFTITNYKAGHYRFEFQGTKEPTTNFFEFPATNGTVNAGDQTYWRGPTNAPNVMPQALGDGRYIRTLGLTQPSTLPTAGQLLGSPDGVGLAYITPGAASFNGDLNIFGTGSDGKTIIKNGARETNVIVRSGSVLSSPGLTLEGPTGGPGLIMGFFSGQPTFTNSITLEKIQFNDGLLLMAPGSNTTKVTLRASDGTAAATNFVGGTFYGNGSGLTNVPAPTGVLTNSQASVALLGSSLLEGSILYVATNGNNNNSGWVITSPVLTPMNAITKATNGTTILMQPGLYNIGTNVLVLPAGVNLFGAGTNSTFLLGFADCSGPENGVAPTGGPQISPGDNSIIYNFTITADTNSIASMSDLPGGGANATHSGSWSGIGVSHINDPASRAFTNVLIKNVVIRNGLPWDCLHINSDLYCDATVDGCLFEIDGGAAISTVADSVTTAQTSSRLWVKNSSLISHTNSPLGNTITANGNGGMFFPNQPSFWTGNSKATFDDCIGVNVRNANASGAGSGGAGWVQSGTPSVFVLVRGGFYTNNSASDASGFAQSSVFGWCQYGNSNIAKWIGNSLVVGTNGPIHSTNIFQVASPLNRKALEVTSDDKIFAGVAITHQGAVTNSDLTATRLMRTDANKREESVTLGTGLSFSGTTLNVSGSGVDSTAWHNAGDSGYAASAFIGTTDSQAFRIKANSLELFMATNTISAGSGGGGVIVGGPSTGASVNSIGAATYSVIIGGVNNTMSGITTYNAIVGGNNNTAAAGSSSCGMIGSSTSTVGANGIGSATVISGASSSATANYSTAIGRRAQATSSGTFVAADSQNADFSSAVADSFSVRAQGGAFFELGTSTFTNRGSMQITNSLVVGTNGPIHGTNDFQVSHDANKAGPNRNTFEVNSNVFVNTSLIVTPVGGITGNGAGVTNAPCLSWSGTSGNITLPTGTYFLPPNNTASNCVAFTSDATAGTRSPVTRLTNLRNLYVVCGDPGVGHTVTVTIMTNGTASSIVATASHTTTANDTTHIVPIVAGVEVGVRIVLDASATAAKVAWSFEGN